MEDDLEGLNFNIKIEEEKKNSADQDSSWNADSTNAGFQ